MTSDAAGAGSDPAPVVVRPATLSDPRDLAAVAALVGAYLVATETEKGVRVTDASSLPDRYLAEVEHPDIAYERSMVLLAEIEGDIAGVIVVAAADQGRCEIKRLWTVPHARGLGVARALVQAAVDVAARRGDITVRLTVWSWREAALRLYERSGFVAVASWDARPSLVCMERALRP